MKKLRSALLPLKSSLKAFRASSVKEVKRLKKIEEDAFFAQREASQLSNRPYLFRIPRIPPGETLESVTKSSEPVTQEAVTDAKVASRALYDNCMARLRAANQEIVALRLQLDLKSRELVAVWKSRNAWQDRAEAEERLRKDAEAYIKDVKDDGFYVGVGGSAGYFKLLTGHSGPGAGIALNAGWRFR